MPLFGRLSVCLFCLGSSLTHCYGQSAVAPPSSTTSFTKKIYLGAEAVILANQLTQFAQQAPFLRAEDKDLTPCPALLIGYQFTRRFAVEFRMQDLPTMTGYAYEQATATTYLGFGQRYKQDYLYTPLTATWRATGLSSHVSLSVIAGGGPAWTNTEEGLITPNGTQVFTSSSNGSIGIGSSSSGGNVTATVTQLITQQRESFIALEAGLRGTWQVRPRIALDLTIRQLWGSTASVRDIKLDIQADNNVISTAMRTPIQGVCSGLALKFFL